MSNNDESNMDATTPASSPPPHWMNDLFSYLDEHQSIYIDRLREAVAIPSISSNLVQHLSDIEYMMQWTATQHIERLGGTYELRTNPRNTPTRPLPPILLASFPGDSRIDNSGDEDDNNQNNNTTSPLKTVCVYGHLDVQPASMDDGWDTDPFVLTERDDKLYGRGSTDDKGPALSWLWIIEAYQALKVSLPVNIKIIYEYVVGACVCRSLFLLIGGSFRRE
jgi:nonspecific dipeptidase